MAGRMTTAQILERLGGDAFLQRLAGQIRAVAQATDEVGTNGKVVVTVTTFKPKEADVGDLYVGFQTAIVPTYPKPKPHKTGLFVDGDGMHTGDPRQQVLELRAVEVGASETRTVNVGQPETRQA